MPGTGEQVFVLCNYSLTTSVATLYITHTVETADQIRMLREAALQSLTELQERAAPLLREIERKHREIALLDDLLRLHSGDDRAVKGTATLVRPSRASRTNTSVVENSKRIIAEIGRPLHIAELRRVFLERGIPIPGQGRDANLISHLRRSPEIVRIKRGFYALADSVPEPTSPNSTRPRRRRRRTRKRRNRKAVGPIGIASSASTSSQSDEARKT